MTTRTFRKPSKAEVQRSLRELERLFRPSERDQAEARLRRAKAMMTRASEAVLAGAADAADLGNRALAELSAAKAHLARLDAKAMK